ncbi:TIM-barrel domain-containing protein [Rubrivirga sp. IMCC43871]|uniref:glycoside hydrolase family 31 protein n=1 Tax=Rubrivirga sp. IMCC43871 TaxID=3391575 RepID=UPI00398FB939
MSTYSGASAPAARPFAALPDDRFTLLGDAVSAHVVGSTLVVDCGGPQVAVSLLAGDVARVRVVPTGDFATSGHGAGPDETPFSYALDPDRTWPGHPVTLVDAGTEWTIATAAMTVRVRKSPCRLSFETADGRPFLADSAGAGFAEVDGRTVSRCWKALEPETRFFGQGDKTFELDRAGKQLTFWNSDTFAYQPEQDPIYKSIPVSLVLQPHDEAWTAAGLYFDNTFRSHLDLGAQSDHDWWFGADDGELRYYVFAPDPTEPASLKAPLASYTALTGRTPLPPTWALGYHQSRWNYHDAGFARWIAHESRRRDLPLECIHLDIGHMDGYRVFTWEMDNFQGPEALTADLDALGVRTVVIVDPGVKVDPGYVAYDEGLAGGHFCLNPDGSPFTDTVWPGDVHWPDFSKPTARAWWGDKHRAYTDAGVAGIWNDMNEPAILGGRDFPDDVRFAYDDRGTGETDHREAHNVYGLLMARATSEGMRTIAPDRRPFLLTRACFSGSQRYGAAWTGDNVSSWDHLLLSLRICQSLSLSGVGFCGPDIGGFAGSPTPELFARWIQAGVLYPFMRTHYSHESCPEQEPWSFGPEVEAISRRYLKLRYRLMPTIYSAFEHASRTGIPPLRALALEFPGDAHTHQGRDDQMMLGDTLMACPVVEDGARQREVYFPDVPGGWIDVWTGESYDGGTTHTVDAPLDTMPLYARAGGVVALDPPRLHTRDGEPETLTLWAVPGAGRSAFYFDDGNSPDPSDHLRLGIVMDGAAATVEREGSRGLPYREFEWRFPLSSLGHVRAVNVDGAAVALADALDGDTSATLDGTWLVVRTRTDVQTVEVA